MYNLDFSILKNEYKLIIDGVFMTLFISICSAIIAFVLGSVFAYFRTSPRRKIHKPVGFFVLSIRNTPLLIVIYLFYKGLASINIVLPALLCGILALGIYSASYVSDALLSGINAVPQEHAQASKALGLSRFQSFIYVIYPQALRHSVYILGSQFMNLVKNSSLVSFIAVTDIFYVIYKGIADSYRIYEYFILAIVLYSIMSAIVLAITSILARIYKLPKAEVAL